MTSTKMGVIYLFFIIILGIIFGSIYTRLLPEDMLLPLFKQWQWHETEYDAVSSSMMLNVWLEQIRWLIFMFILGITVIGFPIVIMLNFLKGFLIGASIQFLIFTYQGKALSFILIWLLPHNLFILPAFIVMSLWLGRYAFYKLRFFANSYKLKAEHADRYGARLIIISVLLVTIGVLIEVYGSPRIYEWYLNNTYSAS